MINIQLASEEWVGVQLTGSTGGDSGAMSLKQKLISNDSATLVQGLSVPSAQEFGLVKFNGINFIYYTEGWESEHINVAEYDVLNHIATNTSIAVNSALLGIDSAIVKCSYAFIFNSKVYMVVSCWSSNYCAMLSSTDGRNFTVISKTLLDVVSNFKAGMFGNHCIIPYRIDGYFYWFIEGRESMDSGSPWGMKLLKSISMESGWEMVGVVNGLAPAYSSHGGAKVFYDNGIFKMFYHYSMQATPPSILGYAEADFNNPLYFEKIYYPLLDITRSPFPDTNQVADPEIVEVGGKVLLFAEYVDNSNHEGAVYVWESIYRIYDILSSPLNDTNVK